MSDREMFAQTNVTRKVGSIVIHQRYLGEDVVQGERADVDRQLGDDREQIVVHVALACVSKHAMRQLEN
jgi:hypothetical protein